MFFRKITTKKNGKEYVYVKLIENYRQDGKVKQRVVANFGSLESLSSDRLNYLIASLKKLHREIQKQPHDTSIKRNASSQINELRLLFGELNWRQDLTKVLDPQNCQLAEALLIKALLSSEVNKPVQELCKGLGLVEATSLQFYNTMRKMGQGEVRKALLKNRLKNFENKKDQPIFIHFIKSNFEGLSYEVDITSNVYIPQNYHKEINIMLASDYRGNPLDFEHIEEASQVRDQLENLIHRVRMHLSGPILILDELNILKPSEGYYVAKKVANSSLGNPKELQEQILYLQVTYYTKVNQTKVKEMKANLAKVSAGLENIRADVLLGKLTRESVVKRKAEQVIKTNQCEDLVTFYFDENINLFHYKIDYDLVSERKESSFTTNWTIQEFCNRDEWVKSGIHNLQIKIDQFQTITDQLKIPPINLYVDYHYSPEIISGHIELEITKMQMLCAMNTSSLGGEVQ